MGAKDKVLILSSFWLTVTILTLFAFSGMFTPQTVARNLETTKPPTLSQPVHGEPDEELELTLNVEEHHNIAHASLSLDTGNRHTVIGELSLPGNLEKIVIDHERKLAFLANNFSGLQIVDISDSSNMHLVGAVTTPGNAWDIIIQGDILFLAAARGGLQIIDTSNPEKPFIISELLLPKVSFLKIEIYKDIIFATSGMKGLHLIDVSDLKTPKLVRSLHTSDGAWGVAIRDETLFLTCGQFQLETFNLSTPNDPHLTGRLEIPGRVWELSFYDKYLYLPTRKAGLVSVDISDTKAPVMCNTVSKQTRFDTIKIEQQKAYLTSRTGSLHIYDLDDPSMPTKANIIDLPYRLRNIEIIERTIFLAGGLSGLISVSSAEFPKDSPAKTLTVPGSLLKVIDTGQYYYLLTRRKGLFIAKKNPAGELPSITGELAVNGTIMDGTYSGNHLFLACKDIGIQIIDISTREKPFISGQLNHPGSFRGIASDTNHLYTVDDHGLHVVDKTLPNRPLLLGNLPLTEAEKVIVSSNRAYVASSASGISIIDISNPTQLKLVGNAKLPWPLKEFTRHYKLKVSGNKLYLAAGISELIQFDISDEQNPKLTKLIPLESEANAVVLNEDRIYVTTQKGKLWILQEDTTGNINTRGVIDTLGSGYDILFDSETVLLVNGEKGLTSLQLPQEFNIKSLQKKANRSNQPNQLKIRIPPQPTPATYNLTVFDQGKITEFVGAIKVTRKDQKND